MCLSQCLICSLLGHLAFGPCNQEFWMKEVILSCLLREQKCYYRAFPLSFPQKIFKLKLLVKSLWQTMHCCSGSWMASYYVGTTDSSCLYLCIGFPESDCKNTKEQNKTEPNQAKTNQNKPTKIPPKPEKNHAYHVFRCHSRSNIQRKDKFALADTFCSFQYYCV